MFQLHKCHLSGDSYTVLMKNNGHIYSVRHFQHWKNLDTVFKFMFNPNIQHKNRLKKKRGGRKKSLHPSAVVLNLGCALEFSVKTYKNASAQPKSRPTAACFENESIPQKILISAQIENYCSSVKFRETTHTVHTHGHTCTCCLVLC